MNIYIYNLNFFRKIAVNIYLKFGAKEHYYARFNKKSLVNYPDSRKFTYINNESRKLVFDYFNSNKSLFSKSKEYLFDYTRKYYDFKFTEFFVFMKSVNRLDLNVKQKSLYADSVLKRIYFKKNTTSFFSLTYDIVSIIFIFLKFNLYFLKTFIICLLTAQKDRIEHPEIIYLRKKSYADYVYLTLQKYLKKEKLNSKCIVIIFAKKNNDDIFLYLNNLKNSTSLSLKSYLMTLYECSSNITLLLKNGLNSSYFYDYLQSSYISFFISNLNSKIITGVLLDKPVFSLIYKNKKNHHFCSLNEAFMFKPFRYFDFCNLDVYFYMNQYDKKIINIYGGKIKKYIKTPFFRKDLVKNDYQGISKELQNKLDSYSKKIIFAPTMVSKVEYKPTSINILDDTIKKLIQFSNENNDILIIIKEKKGELRYLKKDYYDFIQSNSNFYVINSLKPKLLNYNQFEEIIPFVDLLITLTATSTTVLQSLDKNVPFISVNNDHPFSFYKNYPHCEVNLNNLANAINYWLNINMYDKELQINQIKSTLNLTNDNGFATITNYFREYLDEKNKIYS